MATGWWWPSPLPAWLGSQVVWLVALNTIVAAIAILTSRARPSQATTTTRRRGGVVTRRASSSVLLQSLRSFNIFSFPSACLSFFQSDAIAAAYQETEEQMRRPRTKASPRALVVTPPAPVPAAAEEDDDEDEDPNAMSMEEAYALVLASRRQRPEREEEEEAAAAARKSVDAKAEEFIRGFKEDLRQQRLNSIYNYTKMLKQRGLAAGRR